MTSREYDLRTTLTDDTYDSVSDGVRVPSYGGDINTTDVDMT